MVERASASQAHDAPLDVAGQPSERITLKQSQKTIQVGVDGRTSMPWGRRNPASAGRAG